MFKLPSIAIYLRWTDFRPAIGAWLSSTVVVARPSINESRTLLHTDTRVFSYYRDLGTNGHD